MADIERALAGLVDAVLGERADRALLRLVLAQILRTAVRDFERTHDPAHAEARLRDHAVLKTWRARKAGRDGDL